MTLISELIEVPEAVDKGAFVLELSSGVSHVQRTLDTYVVTDDLRDRFDDALGLIKLALQTGSSRAAYLDGSFGAGKSHFMAVLHALLTNRPEARAKADLAPIVAKYDDLISRHRFLLVPYHLIGKASVEDAILGGYLAHVRATHPNDPLPAVLVDQPLLDTARRLRKQFGDAAFFRMLSNSSAGVDDSDWGELVAGWDADRFDAAVTAGPEQSERIALVVALQQALPQYAELALSGGSAYVNLDDGLAAISQHAKSLGYDALVLFLDELILWLATRMANLSWVNREASKVSKLIESANANRPVPIVSFVARQRDLRELVGTNVPGSNKLGFADTLKYWEGRFASVKLSDTNLPVIASRRVLLPRSPQARAQIDAAFAQMDGLQEAVRSALLTSRGDRAAFRLTYPFSPAFIETLVALSGALQSERTALRVLQQILVAQRDTLELGQLVPIADLFDALVAGDEPLTGELGALWKSAQKVYGDIRHEILRSYDLSEDQAEAAPATHAVHRDDRIAKTLVLGALLPQVEALRDLTARKVVALNSGFIRSMVPGQEGTEVLRVVRAWSARLGAVQLTGDDANPLLTVRLEGVDIDSVLANARGADSTGARRQTVRDLVFGMLGVGDPGLDGVATYTTVWRGTRRTAEIVYGNIRDAADLGDGQFTPTHDGWRVVLDYPFDEPGHRPTEDSERVRDLRDRQPAHTVCWVPRHFTGSAGYDLGRFVQLKFALTSRFDSLAAHLSERDKALAKQQMTAQRDALESRIRLAILQAYGVITPDEVLVDPSHGGADLVASLEPGIPIQPPAGADLSQALNNLLDQVLTADFPAHPHFGQEVRRGDLAKVHAQVRRALETPEPRIMVDAGDRGIMTKIAQPLRLGDQHAQYFVLAHHWASHFNGKIAGAAAGGSPVTVGDLRQWLDQPDPMGLLREISDLLVLVFVEQTNRSITLNGAAVDPARLVSLPADARLVDQELPPETVWAEASARAQAVFGIADLPDIRTARNAGRLAERVRTAAAEADPRLRDLVRLLAEKGPLVLPADEDPQATDRARLAGVAVGLVEAVRAAGGDVAVLAALAAADLGGFAAHHLGRTIASAAGIVEQNRRVDWNIYRAVASLPPEHEHGAAAQSMREQLREAWRANEIAIALQPRLRAADAEARRLVIVKPPPPPPLPPPPGGTVVSSHSELDTLTGKLRGLIDLGKRLEVTWRELE
jgi:hypothetical protein